MRDEEIDFNEDNFSREFNTRIRIEYLRDAIRNIYTRGSSNA